MKNIKEHKSLIFTAVAILSVFLQTSCDNFFNPDQELNVTEDELFDEWYEYRSVELGMYSIQQELAEQLVVLGELRGDLLTITPNADSDLSEIYNFNISKDNKYASPTNFFKLIAACNNFIRILEREHPEVTDPEADLTNFDRLYGEALCMRAWAYFNAVRIYGKVPFIHESLTGIDEVEAFLGSTEAYVDSIDIVFGRDGYANDTIYNNTVELEKQYWDINLIIDYFTNDLEENVKAVGVDHAYENEDATWEVSIWNEYAMNALLGQMYLTDGDLARAVMYLEKIVYLNSENDRYHLDKSFRNYAWRNILSGMDPGEHILTMWFSKGNQQQNDFQRLFDSREPHQYMLKPTRQAVMNWETIWNEFRLDVDTDRPKNTTLHERHLGVPGDFFRGHGVSYAYVRDEEPLLEKDIREMLILKQGGDFRNASLITENADTVVWKYSYNKLPYDQDANFIVYRAAGIHLWLAEAYVWWKFDMGSITSTFSLNAIGIVNDGSNYTQSSNRPELGVRGRVGFGKGDVAIQTGNVIYHHDPFNNKVLGFTRFTQNSFFEKQKYFEEEIIAEKARELAFEGERFYDLMRVAKRRNDPSFLAKKVSAKYPAGKREQIYNLLLDEQNWYINYFE